MYRRKVPGTASPSLGEGSLESMPPACQWPRDGRSTAQGLTTIVHCMGERNTSQAGQDTRLGDAPCMSQQLHEHLSSLVSMSVAIACGLNAQLDLGSNMYAVLIQSLSSAW